VKSIADSVALPPQPNRPLDEGLGGVVLEIASDKAAKLNAMISSGSEERRQRSMDSANVMKMPGPR